MSQRERILAIFVGALVVCGGGYLVFEWWMRSVDRQRFAIEALDTQIEDKERIVDQGVRALQRIQEYREHSLPADTNIARSEYRAWLLNLAEKQVKLTQPVVTPGSITPVGKTYHRLSFSVTGLGTLEQLTDLLFAIHSADHLHHIRTLDVKPIPDTRLLSVRLVMEAVVVEGAKAAERLQQRTVAQMDDAQREAYKSAILGRNLFAPANRPPEISRISPQRTTTKDELKIDVKASDPDPLDKISFQLAEDAPHGASIDSTGRLRFKTGQKGSYQITVIASDDGVPAKTSRQTFSVSVTDPPPAVVRNEDPRPTPQPHFDDGQFAFVTAITEIDGRRQFWLNNRTTGETIKLFEGDNFEIKRLKGQVSHIGPKSVEVTAAGERRQFELGENLAQGQKLAPPASGAGE